jgi:hypothetical protein
MAFYISTSVDGREAQGSEVLYLLIASFLRVQNFRIFLVHFVHSFKGMDMQCVSYSRSINDILAAIRRQTDCMTILMSILATRYGLFPCSTCNSVSVKRLTLRQGINKKLAMNLRTRYTTFNEQ